MGPISEQAIDDLSLVVNLAKHIKVSSAVDEDIARFCPTFYWVLRDFYHDLEGKTSREYLDDCLQPLPGYSKTDLKKNEIRDTIKKYFKERDCFTMVRPVTEEAKLAHIDDLPFDSLKSDFKMAVGDFLKAIRTKSKPKAI